ncbi:MerR family transcriptional regulator [Paucibacter sp. R3-3]|uniref:MerR family transcriptional regulator n=1 Tax=Roseateles agri TaxID=3098619 RepID=A0ABU5DLJ9_9BURK|nr:MerR family transcriptional regulator [Paucibacter sp. R3-3]MDY0747173.1 MerR family transcriptional regulator [Paucibacter sp. R3-3]
MRGDEYTVGDLARRSGTTVRALHHYEKLGLLSPSGRSEAGYRLYSDADVQVLHRILAYQQMGVALKDIGPLLGPDAPPLAELLAKQITQAEAELKRQQNLLAMLKRVQTRAAAGGPELSDYLLQLMAARRSYERWFSADELQRMKAAQDAMGDEGVARFRAEMERLLPAMREQMERGADPTGPEVRPLALDWIELTRGMPDDEEMRRKGREMFTAQPELLKGSGFTTQLLEFLDRAVAAAKGKQA